MLFESQYNLGDKVWKIIQRKQKEWEKCTFCKGHDTPVTSFSNRTQIVGADGTDRVCPACRGDGGKTLYTVMKWELDCELTIGYIRVQVAGDRHEESYMAHETGIGSGSVYDLNKLYMSKQMAQLACDTRNAQDEE